MKLRMLTETFEEITWDDDSISQETAYNLMTEESRAICEEISQILLDLFEDHKKTREFFIYPEPQVKVDWRVETDKTHQTDPADDWEDTFGDAHIEVRLHCELVKDLVPHLPAMTIRAVTDDGTILGGTALDIKTDLPGLEQAKNILLRAKNEIFS